MRLHAWSLRRWKDVITGFVLGLLLSVAASYWTNAALRGPIPSDQPRELASFVDGGKLAVKENPDLEPVALDLAAACEYEELDLSSRVPASEPTVSDPAQVISGTQPRLLVYTFSTSLHIAPERFLTTAKALGYHVTVLGMGEDYTGNGLKLVRLKQALETLQLSQDLADTIVLFVDCFDLIFLAPEHETVVKFLEHHTPGTVLISAEYFLWPKIGLHELYTEPISKRHVWNYGNSGSFIGNASAPSLCLLLCLSLCFSLSISFSLTHAYKPFLPQLTLSVSYTCCSF